MPALLDAVVATLLGSCVFLVHDVGYLLQHPYWLDESWVADSTRAPLTSVPFMTSSSPLGWTYLLRVAVVGGEQRARLVPLAFAGLAVGLAYYLGRELRPGNILTGLLCGTAVLLVPAMLVRDDLKQYTAEAAATLLLVLLLARLETEWSRSRLFALVVGCVVALVFASTVLFTATAVFVSLVLVAAVRAEWRRLRDAAVGAAIAAAGMGVVYLVLLRPHRTAMLTAYWRHFYLPTNAGAGGLVDFVRLHGGDLAPYVGFRHWGITLVLFVAGTWTLWRWHRQELAIVVPLLALFVSVASARQLYPFLDLRTSTFWIVVVAVVMAIGVAGVVELASTASRPFGLALLAAAVVVYAIVVGPFLRSHDLPNEDVRSQVRYVEQHRRPDDAVIIDFSADWGFAYYARDVAVHYRDTGAFGFGFGPTYPDDRAVLQTPSRLPADIERTAAAAKAVAFQRPDGRIWLIRSHVPAAVDEAWRRAFATDDVQQVCTGPEPLWSVTPSTPGRRGRFDACPAPAAGQEARDRAARLHP